jgi:hypothetical protein
VLHISSLSLLSNRRRIIFHNVMLLSREEGVGCRSFDDFNWIETKIQINFLVSAVGYFSSKTTRPVFSFI